MYALSTASLRVMWPVDMLQPSQSSIQRSSDTGARTKPSRLLTGTQDRKITIVHINVNIRSIIGHVFTGCLETLWDTEVGSQIKVH